MSTVTIPMSSGQPRGRGSGENKGRTASKGRKKTNYGQLENPTVGHPGKTVVGGPVATPRKPLSLIDSNTKAPLPTPAGKGQSLATHKKSETKKAPVRPSLKLKHTTSQTPRVVPTATTAAVRDEETADFPDIETMSRRAEEPDEYDVRGLFVPPAYFSGLTAALKQPLVPPFWGPPNSSVFPSLPTEPEVTLRPVSPVDCDLPYTREELNLPEGLPDIDLW